MPSDRVKPDSANSEKPRPDGKLTVVDVLLLVLGLASALSVLLVVAFNNADHCSTKTTTSITFDKSPAQPQHGTQTTTADCHPQGPFDGYPEAALIVGFVLVLPALSRRIAEGIDFSFPFGRIAKSKSLSPADLAAAVVNASKLEELADPAATKPA